MKKMSKADHDKEFAEASAMTLDDFDLSTATVVRPKKKIKHTFRFSGPESVRGLRIRIKKSQSEFARMLNINIDTLQGWEQGRRKPAGPAIALLTLVAQEPKVVKRVLGGP